MGVAGRWRGLVPLAMKHSYNGMGHSINRMDRGLNDEAGGCELGAGAAPPSEDAPSRPYDPSPAAEEAQHARAQ